MLGQRRADRLGLAEPATLRCRIQGALTLPGEGGSGPEAALQQKIGGPVAALDADAMIAAGAQALTLLGRRSLVYYLLHQPVLIGTMMLVSFILGQPT